ncbi:MULTISPECIES: HAD-IIIA family hydrolase [unclassified Sporosarcina]|uniref:D-glycero-alpha-D-manno-heptose-1,7-bisphosphate 7-phosphatase n=1 Tax=unclassified Sporosarcina TaxID=2647733 RepID=UPI000C16E757|nr:MULTISPECIES: HAD family hydrolase [unclassified Sporosarcina]PID00874.1 D-glycero-beta-D-manno-heptose-1,7-bisphosphate 7-phosphatase [Sporosarcina sp. P29]PID07068.1 D-glycero-beta-D-manno-heptose-1,7-bisphosphate 7-phosphatase [Sporosarcina sp. P30]PID10264.1 D-glycero-beta-D-manno-heptose-1,7-bisphosphate 7-phosphatase [Sporosarcina sp. P31]PID12162.1 D-glycero-beta-D-manno-heptose-1,7-bisphosphate 7-phosphatase [Sporosarcina sp. P32b]
MKKAVFLDRDGVINEVLTDRVKFVNEPNQLYFLPGVAEAIKELNQSFDYIFVVTNQGGVGLGYMKESKLKSIHDHMIAELAKEGAIIDEVAYCPHKPKSGCDCRKPHSKLIEKLAKKHNVNLSTSYMIGDTDTDIIAGKRAGTKTVFLGTKDPLADAVFPDLLHAVPWIIDDMSK